MAHALLRDDGRIPLSYDRYKRQMRDEAYWQPFKELSYENFLAVMRFYCCDLGLKVCHSCFYSIIYMALMLAIFAVHS